MSKVTIKVKKNISRAEREKVFREKNITCHILELFQRCRCPIREEVVYDERDKSDTGYIINECDYEKGRVDMIATLIDITKEYEKWEFRRPASFQECIVKKLTPGIWINDSKTISR